MRLPRPRTRIASVERVSDGDTITAITSNQTKLRIRLLGTDAPRSSKECGVCTRPDPLGLAVVEVLVATVILVVGLPGVL